MDRGSYQRILCGVDFTAHCEAVAAKALKLADVFGATLTLMHVVEYLPVALDNELLLPPAADIETQLLERADKELHDLATRLGAVNAKRKVALGATKFELLRAAEESQADLIVVGSHGRHGLGRILGSTANAVLHGAPCDVLAVRSRA